MEEIIFLFTDGSSRGNPGPGGWCAILKWKGYEKCLCGGEPLTTNNRMELFAVIEGLKAIKKKEIPVHIYSDSSYVVNAIEKKWLTQWVKIDFKNKKNKELWEEYLKISDSFKELHFHWIKGHAGHPENERCDKIALNQATQFMEYNKKGNNE